MRKPCTIWVNILNLNISSQTISVVFVARFTICHPNPVPIPRSAPPRPDLIRHEAQNKEFADEFVTEAFIEVNDFAVYCCAVVHNAAKGLPDFLEYMGDEHSTLPVKHGVIGHPRELETSTMQV